MKDLEIGKKLKKTREKAGLSQMEVAEVVGCTNQSISQYESGMVPYKHMEAVVEFIEAFGEVRKTLPEYGRQVRLARNRKGLTQHQLGSLVRCNQSVVSAVERGGSSQLTAPQRRSFDMFLDTCENPSTNGDGTPDLPLQTARSSICDWSWAVAQMKSGRRVMVPVWSHGEYICMNSAGALLDEKNRAGFTIPAPVLTREDWRLALQAGDPGTYEWALKQLEDGRPIRQHGAPNLVWKTTREQRQATDWELAE